MPFVAKHLDLWTLGLTIFDYSTVISLSIVNYVGLYYFVLFVVILHQLVNTLLQIVRVQTHLPILIRVNED